MDTKCKQANFYRSLDEAKLYVILHNSLILLFLCKLNSAFCPSLQVTPYFPVHAINVQLLFNTQVKWNKKMTIGLRAMEEAKKKKVEEKNE